MLIVLRFRKLKLIAGTRVLLCSVGVGERQSADAEGTDLQSGCRKRVSKESAGCVRVVETVWPISADKQAFRSTRDARHVGKVRATIGSPATRGGPADFLNAHRSRQPGQLAPLRGVPTRCSWVGRSYLPQRCKQTPVRWLCRPARESLMRPCCPRQSRSARRGWTERSLAL